MEKSCEEKLIINMWHEQFTKDEIKCHWTNKSNLSILKYSKLKTPDFTDFKRAF